MSMQLSPADLIIIAGKVDELSKIKGIDIRQLKVGKHVVFLKREINQSDGDVYYIVGISDKDHPFHEPAMRGGGTQKL